MKTSLYNERVPVRYQTQPMYQNSKIYVQTVPIGEQPHVLPYIDSNYSNGNRQVIVGYYFTSNLVMCTQSMYQTNLWSMKKDKTTWCSEDKMLLYSLEISEYRLLQSTELISVKRRMNKHSLDLLTSHFLQKPSFRTQHQTQSSNSIDRAQ